MIKDQCVSVTDLRKKTKQCLSDIDKYPKYVFSNNKMVAVIMDVDQYEKLFYKTDLQELEGSEINSTRRKEAAKALKTDSNELIDL